MELLYSPNSEEKMTKSTMNKVFTQVRIDATQRMKKTAQSTKLNGYEISVNKLGKFIVAPKKRKQGAKRESLTPKFRRPSYRQIRQETWAIKVMPDFSSSGVWYFNPPELGDSMAELEDLNISKELASEFEQWIRYYDTCFKPDYSSFKSKKMTDKMNAWGMALAKKLKKELPKKEIWYWAELFDPKFSLKKTKIE